MNITVLIQYLSYLLIAVGVLAFIVSIIVQAVKEMPGLARIHTNVVALVVSLILCPAAGIIVCQYFKITVVWYYVFASFLVSFAVYLVSTGGWKKIARMWEQTRYKGNTEEHLKK